MSDSLWPHGLQHARLPCPSPTPRACSNSCPLSQWCHPTISSSVVPFSSCLQSFPASGSFPMSQLFSSGGQSIGASAASVLPMNIQAWFPLELNGLISARRISWQRSNHSIVYDYFAFNYWKMKLAVAFIYVFIYLNYISVIFKMKLYRFGMCYSKSLAFLYILYPILFLKKLIIYFWPHWVFVAVHGLLTAVAPCVAQLRF